MTGTSATAIIVGQADDSELASAGRFGAAKVLHAARMLEAERAEWHGLRHRSSSSRSAGRFSKVIVLAKSSLADAMTARLAGKLKAGLAANVVELPDLSNGFRVKSSIYTGKAFAYNDSQSRHQDSGHQEKYDHTPRNRCDRTQSTPFTPALERRRFRHFSQKHRKIFRRRACYPKPISSCRQAVDSKAPKTGELSRSWPHALHAATACSKPVSDLDWRPHSEHVGQTGLKD
jgi:electron transfer flavoprotein alpha subunit